MSHADALPTRQQIDAKRILATSGAIAVHVAVLMMLMMPPETRAPVAEEDPWTPPPQTILPKFIEPPPKPEPIRLQPVRQQPAPTPIVEAQVEPVDSTPSVVDVPAVDVPPMPYSFEVTAEASPFQQLATIASPPPPYPRMAAQRHIEGTVVLRIHVDAAGNPVEVSVEESSGSRILDEAALKFVKARWKFVPAQSNGQAVEGWARVPIEFVLD